MKHSYSGYSLGDFDKFDCLKLSKIVYLVLIFVLRGYLVWLISITNMKDGTNLITWVFPETSLFYLSLLSGLFGLFVVVLLSLRRPDAPAWIKWSWRHCRSILILALLFDFSISVMGYFNWHLLSLNWLIFQATAVSLLIVLCVKSRHFSLNLQEFPEKLPEWSRKNR